MLIFHFKTPKFFKIHCSGFHSFILSMWSMDQFGSQFWIIGKNTCSIYNVILLHFKWVSYIKVLKIYLYICFRLKY